MGNFVIILALEAVRSNIPGDKSKPPLVRYCVSHIKTSKHQIKIKIVFTRCE